MGIGSVPDPTPPPPPPPPPRVFILKELNAAECNARLAEGYGDPHIHTMARLEQVLKRIKMVQSKDPKEEGTSAENSKSLG